ncbi:flagellar protein FlaG [Desulfobotulus alkaliphilus]|uniref:Flagellar protein FlaG n=1 Tax=Desulfobotulus alkaliphilus TaxID=622671 RepID=A0A562RTF8_9BACT|nr:flagellar protein FlaG [Desulfobotulus alkaliphilus]TWI72381.1 flagellar protein FlaG [Desulfobotulus alkaliphilus]
MDITSNHGIKQTGDTSRVKNISEIQGLQENKPRTLQENKMPSGEEALKLRAEKSLEKARQAKEKAKDTPMEELEKATDDLNKYMDELKTSLGFTIHDETNELLVNIINRDTKEIIKQIPPEELVAIREKMAELAGILLDERV